MFTRTVKITQVSVKYAKESTQQFLEKDIKIIGHLSTKQIATAVKAELAEDETIIRIGDAQKTVELYGIDDKTFFDNAVKLDPATRKPITE